MPQLDDVLTSIASAAAGEVAANAPSIDSERRFPEDNLRVLAASGAYGLVIPPEHGGSGGGLSALVESCEVLGSACASTAMVFLMHSVTAATIGAGGGVAAEDALRSMAAGDALGTLAFSERGTGAHFYAPEVGVQRSNGRLNLSGRKSFVTSGRHADLYLVLTQGEGDDGADAFLLPRDRPGLSFNGSWDGLGMAGNSSIAMDLTDVEVGDEDRVGNPGQGLDLVFTAVAPFFLVGLAAINTGIAMAAARAAVDHVQERRYPDGSSLAEIQFVQHRIADMDIETRAGRAMVREAADLGEAGNESALVAIMEAKVAATEAATKVTEWALEVTGGRGYTRALPVERHLRDARAGAVMAPTNAVLRSWIGKALTGLPVP